MQILLRPEQGVGRLEGSLLLGVFRQLSRVNRVSNMGAYRGCGLTQRPQSQPRGLGLPRPAPKTIFCGPNYSLVTRSTDLGPRDRGLADRLLRVRLSR